MKGKSLLITAAILIFALFSFAQLKRTFTDERRLSPCRHLKTKLCLQNFSTCQIRLHLKKKVTNSFSPSRLIIRMKMM
jgi:hypothetical protein